MNLYEIVLHILLMILLTIAVYKGETQHTDPMTQPEISEINVFDDDNDNFITVKNEYYEDFIIFYSKEDQSTRTGAIYRYDENDREFVPVTFEIGGKIVKSLDQIIANGLDMWGVSKIYKTAFFIRKDYTHYRAESLEDNTEYMVHPSYAGMIIKYTVDGNGLKTGHVKTNDGYKEKSIIFKKMDFINFRNRYAYLSSDNTFLDIDDNDNSIKFTKPAVLDFIKYKNYILFIESIESTNNLDLSVYDVHKNQPTKLVFPELLEIKDVKMFKVLGHDFYFVLVHNDKITCLWVSTETRYKLGRTICTNMASESIDESNFYFDTKLRNQIFLNFPNQEKKHQTLRSTNKGRVWYEMKFINPNDSPYSLPVHFQFSQYDRRDVMDNLKEIDIQYTESKNGRIPFISYDDGNLWIATPITNSRLVMLKDGMVLVSSHTDTNEINYNVDKGKNTWFRAKLFENQPRVLYIGRLPGEVSTALLITKDVGRNKLIFSSIDFSKILKGECKTRQYESWRLFASGEYCESYRIFDMSTPKPENYCIDTKSHIIDNDVCECTADFYGCAYGYRPWGDACFPDSLMHQIKKPDVCSRETGQKQHELGFINMDESRCKPDKAYGVTPMITTQFCAISDYTDFLLLSTDERMYMYRISTPQTRILKKRSVHLDLSLNDIVNGPFTFDFIRQMTYSLKEKYINEQPFFSISQRSIYYWKDRIINMIFEPISHILIFLTNNRELRALSFLTNFHHLVQIDVAWFKYSHHQRLIWFMTTNNQLCSCQLMEVPVCNQLDSIYLYALVDFKNLRGFFLTAQNELQIQKSEKDFNEMKLDQSIHNVQDFAVLDNHLFYLSESKLIHKNLNMQNSDVELDDHEHFRKIDLYRVSLQSHQQLCKDLNCQFMCVVDENYQAKCVCPPSLVQADKQCNCPDSDPDCLKQLCIGFLCEKKKCLLNNAECNAVNKCGDNFDEIRCSRQCRANEHRCKMKCISKDIDCDNYRIKYQPKKSILIKTTSVGICFLVIWVVAMLLVLSYEMKKHRIRRYRPPVRLENPNRSVHGRYSVADNLPDSQGQAEPVMEVVEKVGEFESADA